MFEESINHIKIEINAVNKCIKNFDFREVQFRYDIEKIKKEIKDIDLKINLELGLIDEIKRINEVKQSVSTIEIIDGVKGIISKFDNSILSNLNIVKLKEMNLMIKNKLIEILNVKRMIKNYIERSKIYNQYLILSLEEENKIL